MTRSVSCNNLLLAFGRAFAMAGLRTLLDEVPYRAPRKPALVEPWQRERPVVLHALAEVHANVSPGRCGGVANTQRVVEQQLVLPNQQQERRQSGNVGENRRNVRGAAIRASGVVARPYLQVPAREPQILAAIAIDGCTRY